LTRSTPAGTWLRSESIQIIISTHGNGGQDAAWYTSGQFVAHFAGNWRQNDRVELADHLHRRPGLTRTPLLQQRIYQRMSTTIDSARPGGSGAGAGIMAQETARAKAAIEEALAGEGIAASVNDLRPLPFEGLWGVASSVCMSLASDLAMKDLEARGALEGLSKKEAKQKSAGAAREKALSLAAAVAGRLAAEGGFKQVEAVNGYINITFDENAVAARLLSEVLTAGADYGKGAPKSDRVMVEHSQPNTHKVFHIGHLRNTVLGIAVSNIMAASGYEVLQATYPGDIGMHVIKCLWCYEQFHLGQEPADPSMRGRWLGDIYAESDARLAYRKDLLAFLNLLSKEDQGFVAAIDRLLKALWRKNTEGEDIAYLLGRLTGSQEINADLFREQDVIVKFWPIIGEFLRDSVENPKPYVPVEGDPEPTTTPEERLETWDDLNQRIDWWVPSQRWQDEVKETFARWERQDPALVKLWEETRAWSLADFDRIFNEMGAKFDVWFFESQVEEEGKVIVRELLDKGIAEISQGLPVVKIDEKLGLATETYRTLPILRSDGTSLYATKDLALTKRKFEDYGVDRAIWIVDVRQSLYFQQIVKVLELWGFEQAAKATHVPYEIVALPDGVISSRKGNVPVYEEIRDQVLARAHEIVQEKNPGLAPEKQAAIARQVGLGSLKYAMLARDNNKIVIFDLEEALSFEGRSAPYIQYAHARASRILEHSGRSEAEIAASAGTVDFGTLSAEELGLLQAIAAFPGAIEKSAAEYRPLLIATYVYELAKSFNEFYHGHPVLNSGEPVKTARLVLVAAVRQVLANALGLLEIDAPNEM
jgi:arginyl-tRNA synthetase